jgi:hypothetical protein
MEEVLAHAIALQKAVVDEKANGSSALIKRRDGTVLELLPV